MKKIITILGKKNTDVMNSDKPPTRKVTEQWKHNNTLLDKTKQTNLLNQIFLDQTFDGSKTIISELKKKLNGYKSQDIEKKIYDKNNFISFDKLKTKLVLSKLICYYCKNDMLLMYDTPRDENQWTLDRIDNNKGHNCNNVVISCLKCNLKRRTTDSDKFKFTKQMKIIKKF